MRASLKLSHLCKACGTIAITNKGQCIHDWHRRCKVKSTCACDDLPSQTRCA
eukprot:c42555_g1_i1 orf=1-153(-)